MKNEKLPRGVKRRDDSWVVYFALSDPRCKGLDKCVENCECGRIERRTVKGCPSEGYAVQQRAIFQRQVAEGKYVRKQPRKPQPKPVEVFIADFFSEYLRAYRVAGKKCEWRQVAAWAHLSPVFATMLPGKVTTPVLSAYQEARQAEGASNATINRELSALSAALVHASELTGEGGEPLLARVPKFPKALPESAPREGWVTDEEYATLAANATEPWLRCLIAAAFTFGFRKSELLNLRVKQVDFFDRWISLAKGSTKNGEARKVQMTAEVFELMRACTAGKNPDDYVFTREDGQHVTDPRKSWYRLCVASGLGQFVPGKRASGAAFQRFEGLLLHDFRRSAIRNMTRRGVGETVAMKISGHKTVSVFKRYDITGEADLIEASRKIEAGQADGTKTYTKTYTSPFSGENAEIENVPKWFRKNGGDDETRTRDLCRDRAAF
jgi:integrase